MDITNPDLTKKVLAALNPNKILSEDQIEKQRFIVRKQFPSFQSDTQKRSVVQQSKGELDKKIKEASIQQQPKRGIFNTLKKKFQGPSISRGKATRRLDISEQKPKKGFLNRFISKPKSVPINTRTNLQKELGINQNHLETFKQKRRTPVKKQIKDIQLQNIFPQKNTTLKSTTNPVLI
jgi:hypothetical protein